MGERNIVLLGFMGTGKTTVGTLLASGLGMAFVDMDKVIEARAGKVISRIFAEDGEPHFRALERALVLELAGQEGLVIACGGGVVLNPDNVSDLGRSGLVVCLSAAPEVILKRVEKESHRPLLEGDERMQRILKILDARRPLYGAIPFQIDTTTLTPQQVVDLIRDRYAGDRPPA